MITKSEIRPGAYYDSVVLMQLQRKLAALPGVDDAGVVMATPANKELLTDFDLLTPEGKQAGADDLLIVVRAETEAAALDAIGKVDQLLKERRSSVSQDFRPRSLDAAVRQLPQADWVLISVPGKFAAGVAEEALEHDKHVFLYSDNVSIEDELRLKEIGREKGLLVMGPDCGTAIINGAGLGFANRVRRGSIGVVGASGTGIQAITVHVHNAGGGISQAIGTGGRDLKSKIGAITALQGLEALKQDDETKVIVLVSKPPAAEVANKLLSAAMEAGKPVVVNFIGFPPPARQIENIHFATSLLEAAQLAIGLEQVESTNASPQGNVPSGYLRGLFSGGTLAYEALLNLQSILTPIYSNVPITTEQKMNDPLKSQGHCIVDLGEDVFTVGRLHPMMDNDLRIRRLQQEVDDPETGVIVLDIVLGEGAHLDPADELAPAIAKGKKQRPDLPILALVIGTDEDPQGLDKQSAALKEAGAEVFLTTAEIVARINQLMRSGSGKVGTPVDLASFKKPFTAINVGVETFYDSLKAQEAAAVQVDWRPPAGGNEKLMDILAKMKNK